MPLAPGTRLGAHEIIALIGAGGMGEVYSARDERLGRTVAIKVLREDEAGEAARRRLEREAHAAAALDHPNICAIHEIGEEAGRPYIVLQYLEGETLARRLERGPLDLREALEVAVSIADALDAAHRHGILHRDVKPQNVMITKGRQVKVMDFGLAKPIETGAAVSTEERTLSRLTQPGAIAGTLSYMSPEQAKGEGLDARSDVFSLGLVLYEMVSGRHPFAAASAAETLSALLTREAAPLDRHGATPRELERIVAKALRKHRDERYQTMRDLLIDLKALREETDHEARLARSDPARRRRGGTAVWLVGAALLALGGVAGRAYLRHRNEAWAASSVARLSGLARDGKYAEAAAAIDEAAKAQEAPVDYLAYLKGRALYLDKKSESLRLIQQMRNEAHRFGIGHHRRRREKSMAVSELDQINGIGEQTRTKLLTHFDSMTDLKKAGFDKLSEVVGPAKAKILNDYFQKVTG